MHGLIGFISDAHGNRAAFVRGVELLLRMGAQQIYFLGDAIGYVPSTLVLDALADLGDRVQCIRGNHEAMLLEGTLDVARDTVYQLEPVRSKLTQAHLQMLVSWPLSRTIVSGDQTLMMVHGSPTDPTYGYVYPDTDLAVFESQADWVFMGNTHRPFIRRHGNTSYVNVGSCAMPRDDGRFASVALWSSERRSARILRYDITAESALVLAQYSTIHPSVRNLYERRSAEVVGDFL